jgi:hypothetical protein
MNSTAAAALLLFLLSDEISRLDAERRHRNAEGRARKSNASMPFPFMPDSIIGRMILAMNESPFFLFLSIRRNVSSDSTTIQLNRSIGTATSERLLVCSISETIARPTIDGATS